MVTTSRLLTRGSLLSMPDISRAMPVAQSSVILVAVSKNSKALHHPITAVMSCAGESGSVCEIERAPPESAKPSSSRYSSTMRYDADRDADDISDDDPDAPSWFDALTKSPGFLLGTAATVVTVIAAVAVASTRSTRSSSIRHFR